jgi:hypothetical protein
MIDRLWSGTEGRWPKAGSVLAGVLGALLLVLAFAERQSAVAPPRSEPVAVAKALVAA